MTQTTETQLRKKIWERTPLLYGMHLKNKFWVFYDDAEGNPHKAGGPYDTREDQMDQMKIIRERMEAKALDSMRVIIRNSERVALKRCPQRWWWSFVDGLEPNQVDTKLWFGGGIHLALAEWYKPGFQRGEHPAKTFARFVRDEERIVRDNNGLLDEPKWIDARDLGMAMLLNYVETYDTDPTWNVISTEQTFQVRSKSTKGVPFIISGTFDGVYRDSDTGRVMLMEHKTAAGIPNTGYLELDDQAGTYFAVAEIVLKNKGLMRKDEQLDGIMYNFLRKQTPDDRPQNEEGFYLNKDGTVSKNQPGPRFLRIPIWRSKAQRQMTLEHIKDEVDLMDAYRSGKLRLTKTPTSTCSWDCSFFRMCQLHESQDDWEEYRDAMFHNRDPYEDHRLEIKSA
jgi:hypothetical protein